MNAIVLAAGLGRRLRPITGRIPKPLLPVIDRPVIDVVIDRLRAAGAKRIGVNLFYHHAQIAAHLSGENGIEVVVEKSLTDTGGPLARFPRFFNRDVMVHNCDILSDFDLGLAWQYHRRNRPLATLLLTRNNGTNLVQTSGDRIMQFHTREEKGFYTFAGIAIYSREISDFFPNDKKIFSIKEALTAAIKAGRRVVGLKTSGAWYDIGGPSAYWTLHHDLLLGKTCLPGIKKVRGGKYISPSSRVETEQIAGFCSIGSDCVVGRGVQLRDSIILPGTRIDRGRFRSAIIMDASVITIK